ncbi:Stage III sporulation protein E [Luteitalea pratensis]|uniref:Stage III sporulation protein E n=1 Tax=Luteitalea pratensis TaxID=1855912 RepID=A0A143PPI7_LUTPR|nr:DNA translocase FtsK [Luteitalea pratensis]AMY10485.1 Stage III sporulation protein E [Luteitalea pratensis]
MSASVMSRRASEALGVALFFGALLWFVALASYTPGDPAWFFYAGPPKQAANFAGTFGAFIAESSFQLLGYASFLIPVVLIVAGYHYFWCRSLPAGYTKSIGAVVLLLCVSALLGLAGDAPRAGDASVPAGGHLGAILSELAVQYLNRTGGAIVILSLGLLGFILTTQVSLSALAAAAAERIRVRVSTFTEEMKARREVKRREEQRREVVRKRLGRDATPEDLKAIKPRTDGDAADVTPARRQPTPATSPTASTPAAAARPDRATATAASVAGVGPSPARIAAEMPAVRPKPPVRVAPSSTPTSLPEHESELKAPAERKAGGYTLPPLALLDPAQAERKVDERELMDSARQLEDKCREFSVEGAVVQILPGPVVTTYEFKPDAGVKYSKITGLSEDLSLAMRAESVLIDRIPGKSTVGIQIPNPVRESISLRELLESEPYRKSSSKLAIALGKTIHGEPYVSDLATMPHLLIAGSTGTGKSVGLNAMLTSILYRATPDQVRFIMIDPKRLELGMYEDIPHLLTPVVVEPKLAANALRWAVREMEERYKTLAAFGVRNIEQFNRNLKASIDAGEVRTDSKTGEALKPLPFVVVVIDELADLMMVASSEVEQSICRLAQMARAVGIHLILATQRPSVDVITGLIKANMPSRISFRVSSKVDSRTILDANGAEQLLGKGDMLFLPPASSRVMRLHGAYISEQESARLASFLRKQGQPSYDRSITDEEKSGETMAGGFEKDDLYDEAARIVVSSAQASISYLQRRLRIGFSRAARLVDMMEAEGLVSSGQGGKAREVLVPKDYFDEVDAQLR